VRRNRANRQRLRPTKLMSALDNERIGMKHSVEFEFATCRDLDGKEILKT
jgi:hypothetical protein